MTDKELLELAAKAAGYDVVYEQEYLTWFNRGEQERPIWNPLTNDGDALRLAVMLKLNVCNDDVLVEVFLQGAESTVEPLNEDPYAATRRAIVCAAAEIGKEKR